MNIAKTVSFIAVGDAAIDFDDVAARCEAVGFEGIVIDRIVPPPAGLPYRPTSDLTGGAHQYDAIISLHGNDAALRQLEWNDMLGSAPDMVHSYAVEARLVFDRGAPRQVGTSAGFKLFGRLMFHADMPDSAARRSWALHAGLAERVHVGASRYVQNWVVEMLTPGCPETRGMPEMSFPSEADLIDRFFDSDRGRDEILQDTAHFVAWGPRFYAIEQVVRLG